MDSGRDRLSVLPDDLILKILSFVGLKDAIGTSVLSPRWRFMWTSIPHLSFSTEDFSTIDKFTDFFTNVLSRRNNQVQLSSVNLYICIHGKDAQDVAQRIMNRAFSLNVQRLNVTCLSKSNTGSPLSLSLSLSDSQTLRHLTLTRPFGFDDITLTSTRELSSLTTLHLDYITFYEAFFSNCPNLENLTLHHCSMMGSAVLSIYHPRLSRLTLDNRDGLSHTLNVVTPRLKNLTVIRFCGVYTISAPELASLLFRGFCPHSFSTDGFPSLEKAELSLYSLRRSSHAHKVISLLQKLHNVKVLSLSLEIIQLLNSSVELISHQLSPFADLKSLKILPEVLCLWRHEHKRVVMSTEVKNYLLNSSPKATLTEVLEHCCNL